MRKKEKKKGRTYYTIYVRVVISAVYGSWRALCTTVSDPNHLQRSKRNTSVMNYCVLPFVWRPDFGCAKFRSGKPDTRPRCVVGVSRSNSRCARDSKPFAFVIRYYLRVYATCVYIYIIFYVRTRAIHLG